MHKSDRITRDGAAPNSWVLVVALALAVVAGACAGDDQSEPSRGEASPATSATTTIVETSTTEVTTTTSPAPSGRSVEDEIVARYIGYWDARFAANSGTPDPDDPGLREFATGVQLDAVVAETQTNLEQGLAFRLAENPADYQLVTVLRVNGDRATVQECVVSDGVIIRRDSGEVVNDDVATHNVRAEMQRVAGAWRVSAAELLQRWEGVAGCAHAS